jgi:hypothetical protein
MANIAFIGKLQSVFNDTETDIGKALRTFSQNEQKVGFPDN